MIKLQKKTWSLWWRWREEYSCSLRFLRLAISVAFPSKVRTRCNREYWSSRARIESMMGNEYIFFLFVWVFLTCVYRYHIDFGGIASKLLIVSPRFGRELFSNHRLQLPIAAYSCKTSYGLNLTEHLSTCFLLNSHVKQKRLVLCLNARLECILLKKIKCIYHCKECKFYTVKF